MEIAELKTRLSILEVASHLGIKPDKTGKALCPFHDDKNPSLQLSKEKNIATCFSSACDAGTMDIIKLTEKALKLTTHEALLKLTEWAGGENNVQLQINNEQLKSKLKDNPEELSKIALLTKAFLYFENGLKLSKPAKAYLKSRNLSQATPTEEGVDVGYNSGGFHQKENSFLVASAVKWGLVKPSPGNAGGYTTFGRNCLVFPLRNPQKQITGLYFRAIEDKIENKHYYLKDRQGLYPQYPKAETKKLILTEAIIDAATLLSLPEIKEEFTILALYGTNGLTEEHMEAVRQLKELEEIIFFFDGDGAGKEAINKQAALLKEVKPQVKFSYVDTPEGEDINSLSLAHESKVFTHLIKKRTFLPGVEKPGIPKPKSSDEEKKEPVKVSTSSQNPHKLHIESPYKISYKAETAKYYINGGLRKEMDSLKVSLVIEHPQNLFKHRSKIDLYEDKQVERIAREAAEKLGLRPDLVELDLHYLTDLLEQYRDKYLVPSEKEESAAPVITLDPTACAQCKAFLSKPNLIKRLNDLIGQAGVIGEENNRIFLFGIASSYKMPDTLHALIQGSSGSGKTHLLIKISNFIPQEGCKRFTRVTESSFYNYGTHDLENKLICLEDLDGMKEEAFFAFRELQSRGMISSSTSGKDESGNIRAYEKIVYGPIASLSATTKGEIYEDNMNRCFLIAVDESKEQTQKIIQYQNRKAAGHIDTRKEQQITIFLQNCVRLLKPYPVINPYADKVNLPEEAHKIRRLNDLYQSYVKQITLLNQYRRKQDAQGRLISEKEDLQVAAEIMFDSIVLKIDELDGSLRLFYERLKDYVKAKGGAHHLTYCFGQRDIRQSLNISKTQLQRYLHDLINLEYIQQSGGFANKGFTYKILYWDNIQALRGKVKRHLQGQLDQLELITI
ncbi:MAG TPA: toprim domain-containing protein [Pedobacter sp.]